MQLIQDRIQWPGFFIDLVERTFSGTGQSGI
jgi:hypothetical protein